MYVKKSFINKIVITLGAVILAVLAFLYCFTNIPIPGTVCFIAWIGCILAIAG